MVRTAVKSTAFVLAFFAISSAVNFFTEWVTERGNQLNFTDAAQITNQRLMSMDDRVIDHIEPGGVFRIVFNIERAATCEAMVQNSLVAVNEDRTVTQMFNWEAAPFRYVPKGKYVTEEILRVPEWLPKRKYMFNRQVRYKCEGKQPAYFTFATLPLEVRDEHN